jgi:2-polyprenyl-3-methyl-5-hydroxy-6-metoxy-1,4-benzoquinol methylase
MTAASQPSINEQQDFWNWHWRHWQERKTINEWKLKRAERLLQIIESLGLDKPKFLDLGCGHGWFAGWLSRFGEVTGIDLSDEAIGKARAEFPGVNFIAADLYRYQLKYDYYDVVVSQEVISHVEDQPRYVAQAARAVRPGGYFLVATGNKFVLDRMGDAGWDRQPKQHISNELTIRGLKRLLHPHFKIMSVQTLLPMGQRGILRLLNSYKLNTVVGALFSQRAFDSLKEWAGLGYQIIVLAQKRT